MTRILINIFILLLLFFYSFCTETSTKDENGGTKPDKDKFETNLDFNGDGYSDLPE
jgi:hypothetical protein